MVALLAAAAVIESRPAGRADGADRNPRAPASEDHRAARAKPPAFASPSSPAASAARSAPKFSTRLETGDIDLLIGTHALFQDEVAFKDLALAVVDEQHRFGVHQRLALTRKGEAVDMLVMTATPIPRTLVLTYFGDMDVSELREKPAGRQPIDTRTIPLDRLDEVDRRGRPRDRRRRARLLGLPAGRGIRNQRSRRGRRTLRHAAKHASARASVSSMAA